MSGRCLPLDVAIARFWGRVDRTGGPAACWAWQGACSSNGYGRLGFQARTLLAHRLAFTLAYGEIPRGMHILHHCDNPPCVNPRHLFVGTDADNQADSKRKGRTARGERHGNAKLTRQAVEEIRSRYALGGVSQRTLAREFGVGQQAVQRVVRRTRWVA